MAKFGNTGIKEIGNSRFFLIPYEVLNDKEFPFKLDEKDLVLHIAGDYLVVSKYGRKK